MVSVAVMGCLNIQKSSGFIFSYERARDISLFKESAY